MDAAIGIALFAAVLLSAPLIGPLVTNENAGPISFAFSAAVYSLVLGYLVLVSRVRGQGSLARDFGLSFKPIDLAIGLGLAVWGKIMSIVFVAIAFAVTGEFPKSGNVDLGDDRLWAALSGILLASLLGPIVEEIFFRGLVLRGVRHDVLRGARSRREQPATSGVQRIALVVAVVASSAAFAGMHLQPAFDPSLLVALALSTFSLGVMHALITLVTGRLGSAIVSHVLFNGISVAVLLAFGDSLPAVSS